MGVVAPVGHDAFVCGRVALGSRHWIPAQHPVDGSEQRVFLAAANIFEVVEIECPDHGAAVPVGLDVLGLAADDSYVVVADPLVSLEGVRAQGLAVVMDHCPTGLDLLADLQREGFIMLEILNPPSKVTS